MTKTIKNIITLIAFVALMFVAFSFVLQMNSSSSTAYAAGTCGSCDDTPTTPSGGGDNGGDPPPPPPPQPPVCDLSVNITEVAAIGDAYRIEWNGGPSSAVFFINGTAVSDSGHANFTFTGPNYDRFRMVGNNGGLTCEAEVRINRIVEVAPTCDSFTATPGTLPSTGGIVTLDWATTNATNATIDGRPVAGNGTLDVDVTSSRTFTLDLSNSEGSISCTAPVVLENTPTPQCLAFTGSAATITAGESLTLNWDTLNATQILIDNAVGDVTNITSKSKEVAPIVDVTYQLTVIGADGTTPDVSCSVPVTVNPVVVADTPNISIIKRDNVDKDDIQLVSVGGTATFEIVVTNTGDENLVNVVVTDPIEPSCVNAIGALAIGASFTYTCDTTGVAAAFTNTAFVTGDSAVDGQTVTDNDPTDVQVPGTPVLTCSDIVLNASATTVTSGSDVTLEWVSTGNVSSVSIDNGIGAVALTGTQVVTVSGTTNYNFTINGLGSTRSCAITISTTTGGGGGGSSSPRCELEISAERITAGDEIELTWDSSRARELTITDNFGNTLVTTEDKLGDEKDDLFEGSITLNPTRNTTYTLLVERGSRDRECKVDVEMDGETVLLQVRDQAPLVSGIALTQVPYTGFEAGPVMTILFYMLLITWALYITYVLVMPKAQLAMVPVRNNGVRSNEDLMRHAEQTRPDVFATISAATVVAAPANLPFVHTAQVAMPVVTEIPDTNSIENQAHSLQALVSSDAARTIAGMTTKENQAAVVAKIVTDAKGMFPLEDGWVVLNQSRLAQITDTAAVTVSPAPTGAGSLAEAIVTGNVAAAYDLVGNRPMIALADAAADLDAVYRIKKGADATISDMLAQETANLSDEQVAGMIAALTGALDGTYTDEASAVKMAIMKAVKVAA